MDRKLVEKLLAGYKSGDVSIEDALEQLATLPIRQLDDATLDTHRGLRLGFPEVIFGQGKTVDQVRRITRALSDAGNNVLATRVTPEMVVAVQDEMGPGLVKQDEMARTFLVTNKPVEMTGKGRIAVLAAGTSDLPVAKEAAFTAVAMGNEVDEVFDVGVAGIHRLLHHQEKVRRANVLVVVAGMEGALPSVVGGLVSRPVIAVPTSVGYGAAFGGLAALLGMLNSCAPGVTVVNIDNGFGAGYAASLMNREGVAG
jgi:pyridinium-3,5-biscarboxylic acid mononucleotide synthase